MKRHFFIATVCLLTSCSAHNPTSVTITPPDQLIVQNTPVVIVTAPATPKVESPFVGKPIANVIKSMPNVPYDTVDPVDGGRFYQFVQNPKKPKCVVSYFTDKGTPEIVKQFIDSDPATCK